MLVSSKTSWDKRLALVFFLSGMSSLLYQVSWQRILTVTYGVGALSITLIVSIFMMGLGLGSLLGGELASRFPDKSSRLYFYFEILLGIYGLASLPILQILSQQTSGASVEVYSVLVSLFLSFPTFLMGASLPLLVESEMRSGRAIGQAVGELYCANTLGASFGSIFSAYVLITLCGLDTTIHCASAINFLLAILFLPKLKEQANADQPVQSADTGKSKLLLPLYTLAFISGFVAIGLELCWFRTIEILVKASPYAFASVLSMYLLGLALGGGIIGKTITGISKENEKKIYFLLQVSIAVYVLASYSLLNTYPLHSLMKLSNLQEIHPYLSPALFESAATFKDGWFAAIDIFVWTAYFMLYPTMAMGASFPLLSSITSRADRRGGKTVSLAYFANVLGNVLGGLVTGFVFFGQFGTATSVLILALALLAAFALSFAPLCGKGGFAKAFLVLLPLLLLIRYPSNQKLIELMHYKPDGKFVVHLEEDASCVSLALQKDDTVWHWINGLAHGGRLPHMFGYYNRAIEAISYARQRNNVLIIGFGTGSIVDAILHNKEIKSVTIVELNPAVMTNLKKMQIFRDMLSDARVELIIDDGRRYLNRTDNQFDIVLMDPLRSSTAYSNNIYSKEFFASVKKHLTADGILMVWLDNFTTIPATIASEFDFVRVFHSYCLASTKAFMPDAEQKLSRTLLLNTFKGDERDKIGDEEKVTEEFSIARRTALTGNINRDLKPVTEYYLWH